MSESSPAFLPSKLGGVLLSFLPKHRPQNSMCSKALTLYKKPQHTYDIVHVQRPDVKAKQQSNRVEHTKASVRNPPVKFREAIAWLLLFPKLVEVSESLSAAGAIVNRRPQTVHKPAHTLREAGPHHTLLSVLSSTSLEAVCLWPKRSPSRHWWWRRCAVLPAAVRWASLLSRRLSEGARPWGWTTHLTLVQFMDIINSLLTYYQSGSPVPAPPKKKKYNQEKARCGRLPSSLFADVTYACCFWGCDKAQGPSASCLYNLQVPIYCPTAFTF